jgi:hypothetical protein
MPQSAPPVGHNRQHPPIRPREKSKANTLTHDDAVFESAIECAITFLACIAGFGGADVAEWLLARQVMV